MFPHSEGSNTKTKLSWIRVPGSGYLNARCAHRMTAAIAKIASVAGIDATGYFGRVGVLRDAVILVKQARARSWG